MTKGRNDYLSRRAALAGTTFARRHLASGIFCEHNDGQQFYAGVTR
jgi:hypothetical protein